MPDDGLMADDAKLAQIRSVALFGACSPSEVLALGRSLDLSTADAGTVLVAEGDRVRHWAILVEGTAVTTLGDSVTGMLRPGDFYGERALVARTPSSVAVVALEPVTLLTVERRGFLRLVERHPSVASRLVAQLSLRPAHHELARAYPSAPSVALPAL
jgi:CRP-like cAMP-binding protein